jgi:ribose/xylose/arabinose/galactoside ABC-type transport system permease subunit
MTDNTTMNLKKQVNYKELLLKYKMLLILLAMIIGMTLASNVFLSSRNIVNIMRQISINAIIATGMTFVIITGGIDLSVGSILAVSAVVSAYMVKHLGVPIPLVMIISIVAGGLCGLCNGLIISRLNVPPFISTLAVMTAGRGLAYRIADGRPIVDLSESFLKIGRGKFLSIPNPIWYMILILFIGFIILQKTKFGRFVYYIGDNEEAARVSGISVKGVKTIVYTLAGLCAGFGGVILCSRINSGQPQAGLTYELDAIAAVVIGGTSLSGGIGSIGGTIIGAVIIGIIYNGMNLLNVSPFNQMIAMGLVILGAVILDMYSSKK